MVTMTIDHIAGAKGGYADLVGNLAMPIYVYRTARGGVRSEKLYELALIAEVPYCWVMGSPVNVIWLFWFGRLVKELQEQTEWWKVVMLGIGGWWIFSQHVSWVIWVPLLVTRDPKWWYGIHGAIGVWDPQWWIHLVGYEVARCTGSKYGPGRRVWRSYYPLHLVGIGLGKWVREWIG